MIKKVRAMFECVGVEENDGGFDYFFRATTADSEESKEFFKWTPYGELSMGVMRERLFEVGKLYYLDFTPVEEE